MTWLLTLFVILNHFNKYLTTVVADKCWWTDFACEDLNVYWFFVDQWGFSLPLEPEEVGVDPKLLRGLLRLPPYPLRPPQLLLLPPNHLGVEQPLPGRPYDWVTYRTFSPQWMVSNYMVYSQDERIFNFGPSTIVVGNIVLTVFYKIGGNLPLF